MKRRFNSLYETYKQKFTSGGFLYGSTVKFKDNFLKSDFFKNQTEEYKNLIKSWAQSDLLLRVVGVKPVRPTTQGAGNAEITGSEFDVDITQEIAPGRYVEYVTVPGIFLQTYDNGINLPKIPDSLKRNDKVQIKPEVEKPEDEQQVQHTVTSDDGKGKLIKGDRKLVNKNIKIPGSPDVSAKSPSVASYTHKYLPKK